MPNPNRINSTVYYFLVSLSFLITYLLGYQIERSSGARLVALYSLVFAAYIFIIYLKPNSSQVDRLVMAAIGLRLVLLFSFPLLSDDIYRFVWDGRLLNLGIHPFKELPSYYMLEGNGVVGLDATLYNKLNSPNYFTIYPPFAQLVFWISTLLTDSIWGATVIIRGLIILAEIGSIYMLIKLLERYNVPKRNVLLYALNPLVIIELTGNLHFEAFMIFFLLLAIFYLHKNTIGKASLFMAASVASKLIPLMLLPIFIRRLKRNSLIRFYLFTGVFIMLLFLPLFSYDLIKGMTSSVGLYFQKFEFNASVYYLVREVGFWVKGYNIIETAGKYLAIISFLGIMFISLWKFKKPSLLEIMIWVLTFYFLMATTVHPWYISTILMLSIFTYYRFVVLWSFLIFLSYLGYSQSGFDENMYVVILEYLSVTMLVIYEIYYGATGRRSWLAKKL